MRLRMLLAMFAVTAAVPLVPAAHAAPPRYTRECGGKVVDAQCYHAYCGIFDCVTWDCHVWSGALGGGNAAICVGQARPRGPVE